MAISKKQKGYLTVTNELSEEDSERNGRDSGLRSIQKSKRNSKKHDETTEKYYQKP